MDRPTVGVKTAADGSFYLEIDDFYDTVYPTLVAAGWNFTNSTINRPNPTIITGAIAPSGKVCSFSAIGDTITMTIAGNTRTITRSPDQWLDGPGIRQAILDARAAFPAGQR